MGWLPGQGDGAGAEPVPGLPGSRDAVSGFARDTHLPGFAKGGEWDAAAPSATLAAALEAASGPGWRCPGATQDELAGLLRQWQALESWAAAGKLGVLRALVRDEDQPPPGGGYHGDLPEGWTKSLTHEVALALSMPAVSAERLMWLAWNLQALLPATGDLLAAGELTLAKARAVDAALNLLRPEDAAQAETMIAPDLPGKTYGQVQQLASNAALTVDPEAGTRRRRDAERHKSRVTLFREETGAAGLSGRDLPTDQALAAHASVCARAQDYQDSGAFPADSRMDQFRAAAYLDLLNGIPVSARIATGQLVTQDGDEPGTDATERETADPGAYGRPNSVGAPDGAANPGAAGDPSTVDDPDDAEASARPSRDGNLGAAPLPSPRLADLVLPLTTLLGLAERPGEGHGLGPLDPALCRALAAAAIGSQWTRLCLTVTDADGVAIGHGCARRREAKRHADWAASPVHLTIKRRLALPARVPHHPAAQPNSAAHRVRHRPPARLARAALHDPDRAAGSSPCVWPIPTLTCDHRHESHAYQPNDTLRHLVQVRDGHCTFPPCSRHARESDFEHAIPYHQGGRTCACNAGARSRACHQVKQSPGWKVTQPRPGWHQWQTPGGRTYTQGPRHYPA